MRQRPVHHMWRGLNLSKCLSRFFWALVCVCWGLVVQGEFGMAQQRDFTTWLQELRAEAVALGIRPQTLDAALTGLRPLPREKHILFEPSSSTSFCCATSNRSGMANSACAGARCEFSHVLVALGVRGWTR